MRGGDKEMIEGQQELSAGSKRDQWFMKLCMQKAYASTEPYSPELENCSVQSEKPMRRERCLREERRFCCSGYDSCARWPKTAKLR